MDFDAAAADEDRMWAVLRAVESAALQIAEENGWPTRGQVDVSHTTGGFTRPSVDAARDTARGNGFRVTSVHSSVERHDGARVDWVTAHAAPDRGSVYVQIRHGGTDLELNGTYARLRQAAEAVPRPAPEPEPVYVPVAPEPPEPGPWWVRAWRVATTHPLIVTVVGGLLVLALATWLGLSR